MFLEKNRDRIEKDFEKLCQEWPKVMEPVAEELAGWDPDTALAGKYLYANMPLSDIANYSADIFYDFAAHGVFLYREYEKVRKLPEEIFLNYVLYHRVNEEEIDVCRKRFYESIVDYLKETDQGRTLEEMPDKEAALELNFWCAREASYQAADARTASAKTVFESGRGRCGEESVFGVNALRSAGIPARQVYAPRWSHCDDNHAWVEAYLDGNWYFLGACEPELELNQGWFNGAASRAMMIHSRWFDSVLPQDEEVIGGEGMAAMLNQLSRYADTTKAEVTVKDASGMPASGVQVDFHVLNYAEFYPVASMRTGEDGKVSFTTGFGSLYVEARKGDLRCEFLMNTREKTSWECTLAKKEDPAGEWTSFDLYAPHDRMGTKAALDEQTKAAYDKKLAAVNGKRLQKVKHFKNPDWEKFFYGDAATAGWRGKLLGTLTEKDKLDVKCAVLEEHLTEALKYADKYPEEVFVPYVLSPRIWDEVLRPWRKEIGETLTAQQQEAFARNPVAIWDFVDANIKERPERERSSIYTTPAAALRLGSANKNSKKILFVAIARTLGIPARLNRENGSMEYWKDGAFVPVLAAEEKTCALTLLPDAEKTVWKYFQNWSLGRMENGVYRSLFIQDDWEKGSLTIPLVPGVYRILTANRLPSGNIFGERYDFCLKDGEEKTVTMNFRQASASDILTDNILPEFTLKKENGEEVSVSDLTKKEAMLLIWLEESKEPTEHILNELMERQEEFRELADRIAFIIRTPKALEDSTLSKCRSAIPGIAVYYDDFGETAEILARRIYTEPGRWPLIIVADSHTGQLEAVYGTSGYNVGTGDMLLRVMRAEEEA